MTYRRAHRSLALAFVSTGLMAACTRPITPALPSPMSGKRVESNRGMVSASQSDAALAGVEALRLGGNAVDAAVATGFALSVVDVSQTGLGGGGALTFYNAKTRRAEYILFYPRSGEDSAWGRAEPAGTRAMGRAAATPGMVAGLLAAQSRFGVLTREQVMAPAIRLARDGFIVSPLLSRTITSSREKLSADSSAVARFMPKGEALRPGDRLVQPELAATLQGISDRGADAFYTGAVADRLAAKVRSLGGLITTRDMKAYAVANMRPLCSNWRGYTVLGAPPPMGGASVLEMLQVAEQSGVAGAGSFTDNPTAVARLADVLRIGQSDARWRGDPFMNQVPARGVTSAAFARQRARVVGGAFADTMVAGDAWAFDSAAAPDGCANMEPYAPATRRRVPQRASKPPSDTAEGGSYTSHMSVVDADGNAVSATTTVGVLFGSGVYTDGFFLNSAAGNFDATTRDPNRYANSTMSPTIILEGNQVRLVIGCAGSQYIQPAIAQVAIRILAFGEDPGVAIAAPRIQTTATSREVEVEPGFTNDVYGALVARGYRPASRVADIAFGAVHAVFVRRDGWRIGIADPRRDGVAIGR